MSTAEITNIAQQEQEAFTKYKAVIMSDHAYIHRGLGFKVIVQKVGQTNDFYLAFTTPPAASGKDIHWRPANIGTSAASLSFTVYEDDTFTGGTDANLVNLNRQSSNASLMQAAKVDVTSTPTGTIIQTLQSGGGTGGNSVGGGLSSVEERLLKQDTTYVVKVSPAGETDIALELFWYEEDAYE